MFLGFMAGFGEESSSFTDLSGEEEFLVSVACLGVQKEEQRVEKARGRLCSSGPARALHSESSACPSALHQSVVF